MASQSGHTVVGVPLVASVALHAAVIAAFLVLRPPPAPPVPPTYRVSLIAAPPGPRAQGVVQPTPAPTPPVETPPPPRPVREREASVPLPTAKKPPVHTPPKATPTPAPAKPAPKTVTRPTPAPAAGGETGGRGADVANVRTQGIEFPYPGYLENIVRQIALRFHPPRGSALRADVSFLVHRDGSISDLRVVSTSGAYAFDLEAQGAVEAAAQARAFGALPSGFRDDVLPVVFSFDPRLLR